jgi:putative transposase
MPQIVPSKVLDAEPLLRRAPCLGVDLVHMLAVGCRDESTDATRRQRYLTYIRLSAQFIYFAAILDAWSRKVVGYALGNTLETRLTLARHCKAVARLKD